MIKKSILENIYKDILNQLDDSTLSLLGTYFLNEDDSYKKSIKILSFVTILMGLMYEHIKLNALSSLSLEKLINSNAEDKEISQSLLLTIIANVYKLITLQLNDLFENLSSPKIEDKDGNDDNNDNENEDNEKQGYIIV
mgnify:CR=1 FL=1